LKKNRLPQSNFDELEKSTHVNKNTYLLKIVNNCVPGSGSLEV
jgi:hypothetical protein